MVSFVVSKVFFVMVIISAAYACPSYAVNRKYKVMLDNCGPRSSALPVISMPPVRTPCREKPLIKLPYAIPPVRNVDHSCTCTKTVVKPQPVRQLIIVPVLHRFIKTLHKPVQETVVYRTRPVECPQLCQPSFDPCY